MICMRLDNIYLQPLVDHPTILNQMKLGISKISSHKPRKILGFPRNEVFLTSLYLNFKQIQYFKILNFSLFFID